MITQLASTRLSGRTEVRPYDRMVSYVCIVLKMSRVGSRLAETYQAIVFSFCKVSDLACHHTHRYVITTEHLRSSLSNLLIFLTLSLSEAEREVYHNRTVSDGL